MKYFLLLAVLPCLVLGVSSSEEERQRKYAGAEIVKGSHRFSKSTVQNSWSCNFITCKPGKCCNNDYCCPFPKGKCCPDRKCCPNGTQCCAGSCCPTGQECCGTGCCAKGQRCCGSWCCKKKQTCGAATYTCYGG
ncbi:hypothetical protein TNIN_470491 [Trichonephila inaurata madagascariensis]|uniref:Uncharacterized protein n=1 Tax=Trichonephila inaurata madagascariensis TaxID=2747483 RepID=A0A8X6X7Q4_9ARAC|nr:hypothetical protein TNIN_470491 [Trichonephila inaurata madagascariensis]